MLHSGDNDSLELSSLDVNEALAEIQMNLPWCNECQVLKQSLEDLRTACNHKATIISDLKQKIIHTDQLITDFYAKQEENQMLTKSLETCRRQCEELGQQLHSALARLEPLREANGKFERHNQRCEQDIEKLKAENEAYKICQQQSNLAHSTLLEKVKKLDEEKREAQGGLRRSDARVKKLQDEILTRKKENACLKKDNTALENEIKALKTQLAKFKNTDVPFKRFLCTGHKIESSCPSMTEIYDREVSSLLTCTLLQMLPPILSPMASSDGGLSDAEDSDNDPSINHFASQLEAKLGCSDDTLPPPKQCDDDVHANVDEAGDGEESGDDKNGITPVNEVNLSKSNSHLEWQLSTGFDVAEDEDDATPHSSRDGPECSLFTASLASVPSIPQLVPSSPLVEKIAAEVEASGHPAARRRLSSASSDGMACDDEASSACVLPLDIHNAVPGLLSAAQPLSCPVSDDQPPNTSSTRPDLVVSSSSASTVLSSSSVVCVSSVDATCHADSSASLYSSSAAPIMSSYVRASSSFPGTYSISDAASVVLPIACDTSKNSLPSASASYTVSTCNDNSSAVCQLADMADVQLAPACLPVGSSHVKSHLASHETPAASSCVSATSSHSPNSASPCSSFVTVITQCTSAVVSDSVLQSSSKVSGVNSGPSEVAQPTSAVVFASKTGPRHSPCVMVAASCISRSAPPCVSTLNTSSSGVSVVSCNSVPLCSSGVAAKASSTTNSTTHNTSLLSSVSLTAPTTCNNILASSLCVTSSISTISSNASSVSLQCATVSLPTSVPVSSCANRPPSECTPLLSPFPAALPTNAVPPSKPEACLNHSLLRSQISIEDIFSYVNISRPLSPIKSPRRVAKVQKKRLKHSQPTENLNPSSAAAAAQTSSPLVIVSSKVEPAKEKHVSNSEIEGAKQKHVSSKIEAAEEKHVSSKIEAAKEKHVSSEIEAAKEKQISSEEEATRQKHLSTKLSSVYKLLLEIDTGCQPVKQKTSLLGCCPEAPKVLKTSSSMKDVHAAPVESNSTVQVQCCARERDVKTNTAHQRTMFAISNSAPVLTPMAKSNASELVEKIIGRALALTEDVIPTWHDLCTSGQTPAIQPWLTPSQQILVSELCKRDDRTLLQEFCKRAVQVLSYKGDAIITAGNTALCCIFIGVCRYLCDVERVRVFVFDAVKHHFSGYASLITAVVAIWPFPLLVGCCSSEFAPVLDVLQHAILAKSLDASKPKHQKMQFFLEQLCLWKLPVETRDEIARRLLTHLENALKLQSSASCQDVLWNVELAFDLLCITEGWQWSNNFIVVQLLWPVLASWAANQVDVKNQAFIEAVIGILGLVMSHCPATFRSNTDHILNILLKLLKEPTVAVSIQLSVLRALLMLAKYQPDSCATMCLQWVKDHKNDLDSVTKAMLQDFHKQFSSRLKYLSELVIE